MKLVTFGRDHRDRESDYTISSIHTAVHTTTANIILDRDSASSSHRPKHASTLFAHPQVDRTYIVLNSKTYITIRQEELRMCRRIGYEFYH